MMSTGITSSSNMYHCAIHAPISFATNSWTLYFNIRSEVLTNYIVSDPRRLLLPVWHDFYYYRHSFNIQLAVVYFLMKIESYNTLKKCIII